MLSHGAILSQYVSCVIDAEVRAEDKLLHALPLYHCAQLDVFFGPSIYVAAQNIIAARPVPSQLIALIEQHQINSFCTAYRMDRHVARPWLFATTSWKPS